MTYNGENRRQDSEQPGGFAVLRNTVELGFQHLGEKVDSYVKQNSVAHTELFKTHNKMSGVVTALKIYGGLTIIIIGAIIGIAIKVWV